MEEIEITPPTELALELQKPSWLTQSNVEDAKVGCDAFITTCDVSPTSRRIASMENRYQRWIAEPSTRRTLRRYRKCLIDNNGEAKNEMGRFVKAFVELDKQHTKSLNVHAFDRHGKLFKMTAEGMRDNLAVYADLEGDRACILPINIAHDRLGEYYGQHIETLHSKFQKEGDGPGMIYAHCVAEIIEARARDTWPDCYDDHCLVCDDCRYPAGAMDSMVVPDIARRFPCWLSEGFEFGACTLDQQEIYDGLMERVVATLETWKS